MAIETGDVVPDIRVRNQNDAPRSLADFQGRNLVVYFYPKDSTPGCTTEGQGFRDHYRAFQELNTEVIGVSRDSVKSHLNFATKQAFPFELFSDPDEALCKAFDVIKEKRMYGRTFMGVERSTFVIDAQGRLAKSYRKVKVKGHVEQVLQDCSDLFG